MPGPHLVLNNVILCMIPSPNTSSGRTHMGSCRWFIVCLSYFLRVIIKMKANNFKIFIENSLTSTPNLSLDISLRNLFWKAQAFQIRHEFHPVLLWTCGMTDKSLSLSESSLLNSKIWLWYYYQAKHDNCLGKEFVICEVHKDLGFIWGKRFATN